MCRRPETLSGISSAASAASSTHRSLSNGLWEALEPILLEPLWTPGAPGPTTDPQDPGLYPFCGLERCALPLRFTLSCSGFLRNQCADRRLPCFSFSSRFLHRSLCACPVRSFAERPLEAEMSIRKLPAFWRAHGVGREASLAIVPLSVSGPALLTGLGAGPFAIREGRSPEKIKGLIQAFLAHSPWKP